MVGEAVLGPCCALLGPCISHYNINTESGRKKNPDIQESSRQRSNKRGNLSQMLLGKSIAFVAFTLTVLEPS